MAFTGTATKGSAITVAKGATFVSAMREKTFTISSETVDITTADDTNRWRQLLAATGVKNMSISLSGVIKDVAIIQTLMADAIAQTLDTYTLVVPGLGSFTGVFQIASFGGGGPFNAEGNYELTLESGGDITFTAEG